jgi:hypothetical protein
VVDYRWKKERSRKEGSEMLPLEAIGVLGLIYLFFMYGLVKAQLVKKERSQKVREPRFIPTKSASEPVRLAH